MAKYTGTLTADGSVYLCDIVKPRTLTEWYATIHAVGTFGGGTVTLSTSVDGGSTLVPMGSVFSATSNATGNIEKMGTSDNLDDAIKLYAVIASSTSPDVTITVHDNR